MIINFSLIRLFFILLFSLFFPLVQNQWLNLHLFNNNNLSFYSTLYYISGGICPFFVCWNSLNHFTYYKIPEKNLLTNNVVSGKSLFSIVSITLLSLSFLVYNYIFINYYSIFKFIFKSDFVLQINYLNKFFIILIICLILIFRKTRISLKKFVLLNYFIISIMIWYAQLNNLLITDNFFFENNLNIQNINFINIFYLFSIETIYYLWSYIVYKNNLSDWSVPIPKIKFVQSYFNIALFYFFIFVYYSILVY